MALNLLSRRSNSPPEEAVRQLYVMVLRDDLGYPVCRMASAAMDEVRKTEVREHPHQVRQALDSEDRKARKSMFWAIRRNPSTWSEAQRQEVAEIELADC